MQDRFWMGASVIIALFTALASIGCTTPKASTRVIYSSQLTSLDAIITRSGVTLDGAVGRDGHGVIRIDSTGPATIRLAEVRPKDAEAVTLIYRGHLRTQNLRGRAYLEMWCDIAGKGEFFSKSLSTAVTGTEDWVSQQTEFFVEKGQPVQAIRLNVFVEGVGIVWIGPILLAQTAR
jgi:hypothetical protein